MVKILLSLFLLIPSLSFAGVITPPTILDNVTLNKNSQGQVQIKDNAVTLTKMQSGVVGVTRNTVATPSAVGSFTISSLSAGVYELVMNVKQNTSDGYYKITLNSDSGSNYAYSALFDVTSGTVTGSGSSSTNGFIFWNTGALVTTGKTISLHLFFITSSDNTHNTDITGIIKAYVGGTYVAVISGTYSGAADISSITVSTSAGTMTGTATLYGRL